jgi:hypothetical protein
MLRICEHSIETIRGYQEIGFKQIGIRRKALYRNLEKHNIIYMDLLSEDYYAKSDTKPKTNSKAKKKNVKT